ncbi:MAG: hypothetical protein K5685_11205 [Bacteroidales bacterium]|nr:hypothetical protein [Bacteroidales bacterium]
MEDNKKTISGALNQVAGAIADLVERVFDLGDNGGFPFSKFRDEIIERYKYGERNNLGKPSAAQIIISVNDNSESKYKVSLSLYYQKEDGIKRLLKEYEIKSVTNIPAVIEKSLSDNGSEKITFDFADLEEIYNNRELQISTDGKDISSQIYEHIGKNDSATINILDFVLYYKVRIFQQKNEKEVCTDEFLTSKITGLNQQDTEKLSKNHEINLLVQP